MLSFQPVSSDQFYRQRSLQLAKETAEEAFNLAPHNKLNTKLDHLQRRIKFLDDKFEKFKLVVSREPEKSNSETFCSEQSLAK